MATLNSQQIATLIERLNKKHPDARYELDWETPVQLLVGTILAAQCTDERVNKVTPALFKKYPDAKAFAEADRGELEELLKQTGFYRQKAKTVQEVCQALVANHGGEVPRRMEDLVALPGVARKSANVVLNNAFRIPSGIIVDTHVNRVAPRMGLTTEKKPEKIEKDLMKLIPQDQWCQFGPALVLHGRYTCTHHEPRCGDCVFNDFCPRINVGATESSPQTEPEMPSAPANTRSLWDGLPADWASTIVEDKATPFYEPVQTFVEAERAGHTVFPSAEDLFAAFRYTPFRHVKVVLLGQDPYHDDGQAHGLAFSVRPGVKPPPSLANMFKELKSDLRLPVPDHGCLIPWARQGVLLLNTVLTVRAHEPASHAGHGWEHFTDAVIRAISTHAHGVVFLLWGGHAQKKVGLIDKRKHRILKMAHPSPLSAKKFLGSKPYSQTNELLKQLGRDPVDWSLPLLGKKPSPDAFGPPDPLPTTTTTTTPTPPSAPVVTPAPEVRATPQKRPTPAVVATPAPSAEAGAGLALDLALKTAVLRSMETLLPADWRKELDDALQSPSFLSLQAFLAQDAIKFPALPTEDAVYRPLHLTPFRDVRVVLLGEEADSSDGLAWSSPEGTSPALEAMYKELCDDLGCWMPATTNLAPWAERGVLLWNALPTRRAAKAGTHAGKGWEEFTRALLTALARREDPMVFVFLGPKLAGLRRGLDLDRHEVIQAPHPTLANFPGCKLFSSINEALEKHGQSGIWWQLRAF